MPDPRQDPIPGDILRRGACERTVLEASCNFVRCRERDRQGERILLPFLSQWRRWAEKAEAVQV